MASVPLLRRARKIGLLILYVVVLLEIGSRVYWAIKHDMPLLAGVNDWYDRFYEEMVTSGVREAELTADDGKFDIACLGGSALDRICRSTGEQMKRRFKAATGREVRVFNLSGPALSSYDSLNKYSKLLADKKFDLVVFYHAINETRMNNCPRRIFRDDYSHGVWYRKLQVMERQKVLIPWFTLPYTIRYSFLTLLGSKKLNCFVPRHRPNTSWIAEGGDIKTTRPFRSNLRGLIETAGRRGTPVLVMTFAWYVPEGYTLAGFEAKQLDYDKHVSPIEIWGKPEHVVRGIRAHNGVIRELAGGYDNVIFLDAERAIPKSGEYFNDICHLSEKGKALLVSLFVPKVTAFLGAGARPAERTPE